MQHELKKAKLIWFYLTKTESYDRIIRPDLLEMPSVLRPKDGWLKSCREAQLMSLDQAALNAGISKTAYTKIETNEVASTLTLASLRKAAEAIDCELVYFIRPKKRQIFSTLLWEKLLPKALKIYKNRTRLAKGPFKSAVLANIAAELFVTPEVRREMKWARNEKA